MRLGNFSLLRGWARHPLVPEMENPPPPPKRCKTKEIHFINTGRVILRKIYPMGHGNILTHDINNWYSQGDQFTTRSI